MQKVDLVLPKVRLIVYGNVQGVGYRSRVRQEGMRNGLNGYVKNLYDGTVEVFCEGPKENIDSLIKAIDIKGKPEDPLSINVKEIKTYWEGQEGYKAPRKRYKGFHVEYAESTTKLMGESVDRLELGIVHMARVENVLSSFKNESNKNFEILAEKYGKISEGVGKLEDKLGEILTGVNETRGEIVKMREEVIEESKKSREAFERMEKMLAKHLGKGSEDME